MPEPLVGIVMGSDSDWPVMEPAAQVLTRDDALQQRVRPSSADDPA